MTSNDPPVGRTIFLADVAACGRGYSLDVPKAEAKHLRSLRLRAGDAVWVTDGKGARWKAVLVEKEEGRAVRLEDPAEVCEPLATDLWVPVGNKSALLWLAEKATELGVARIQPVEFERSGSVADAGRSPGFWEKAGRRAVSALKQSGGAWLPEVLAPRSLPGLLSSLHPVEELRVVLDRDGEPLLAVVGKPPEVPAVVVVGPEGGLTADELSACGRAGFVRATLGESTLRFETAAVAALAVLWQGRLVDASRARERNVAW